MEIHGIGEFILRLRIEKKISQTELARGLCTQKFLSKIETGDRLPDTFLLDAFMSRLGKSSDKLEYIVSREDYQLFVRRIEIRKAFETEHYDEAEKKIVDYENSLNKGEEDALHWQYLDMMHAFLLWKEENKSSEYIVWLESAMNRTMPFWREKTVWNHAMTWTEAGLLLLWARKVKSEQEMYAFFENMLDYIKKQWDDEEEKVKIYPFTMLLYSRFLLEKKEYRRAEQLSNQAILFLTRNNAISNLLELLQVRIEALESLKDMGQEAEALERLIRQKGALNILEKEYGYKDSVVDIFAKIKKEFYLDQEIIRKNRIALGMTQEELSEDICAQETLARIEKGRTPHNKNFQKLAKKVQWKKEKRANEISCWDYAVLERKQELDRLVCRYQYKEAKEKLEEFPCLDTLEGKQYVCYMMAMIKMELKEIEPEEAFERLVIALKMTLPINDFEKLHDYILTKQEVLVLNGIGIVYSKMGERQKAIRLYKNVLNSYNQSEILPVFKASPMLVVLGNLASFLEEADCFDESLEYQKKKMELELMCKRIAKILASMAYTLERKGKEPEKRKKLYIQAYYISDLVEDMVIKKIVTEHFQDIYGYTIEDERAYPREWVDSWL